MGNWQEEGKSLDGSGLRVAVVAARFNDFLVEPLVEGALAALRESGVEDSACDLVRVPGAFELPLAVRSLAAAGRYDAIVALGAVVRGETPHFDFVAGECSRLLAQAMYDFEIPVGFGVLTVDDEAQGRARAGGAVGNKGREATLAALEMASLLRGLRG